MVTVPARDLKNRTGEIVRRIERGEHVLITKRGKPLAVVQPARGGSLRRGKRREELDVTAEGVGLLWPVVIKVVRGEAAAAERPCR